MMRPLFAALAALLFLATAALAQDFGPIQTLLQANRDAIVKSSRKTIEPAIAALQGSGLPGAQQVLERWEEKQLWLREADGLFVFAAPEGDGLALTDIDSGAALGAVPKSDATQLKPNSGIRSLISLGLLMVIFGFLSFRSWWRRLIMITAAAPVAIAGNGLRLTAVIVVGEIFGSKAAMAVEQKLGFLTFALGFACMLLLGRWLREPTPTTTKTSDPLPTP